MLDIRRSEDRGRANFGWLNSRHTFSFGHYYDPRFMGFGPLRVINEDVVEPSRGFGPHPHHDAEILSFVLSGALLHEDSTGAHTPIRAGEVQRMTAGRGVVHARRAAQQDRDLRPRQLPEAPGDAALLGNHDADEAIALGILTLAGLEEARVEGGLVRVGLLA